MSPNEQFLGLAALLPEPMLLLSPDGRIHAANPAFADRVRIPRSALQGRFLTDLTATEPSRLLEQLRLFAGGRQMLLGSLLLQPVDAPPVPCRMEGALFSPATAHSPALLAVRLLPTDSTASRFVALNLKIDELSAEVARRVRTEAALREQRQWLEVTLSSIGEAVVATDRKGRIVFLNAVASALTGWPGADAVGRRLGEVVRIVEAATRIEVESPAAHVLREGRIALATEAVLISRDGSERPIDESGAPILDPDGHPLGVVLVFRDVTARRDAARAAAVAREAAETANRAKDQFLAMLSHELRTPLNAILGWARMLQLGAIDDVQRARAVEVITRNAELQAVLIEDLLDVSRIITGKLRLRHQPVEMRAVTEAALDAVRPAAQNRQVALDVDLSAGGTLLGDPERLQQIAWNLLSNAVKFTPPGGRVTVRLANGPGFVQLTVADTGEGFDPAFRPFLFDAFRQADATLGRRTGGLGLGLTIVRHLVEAHGGVIDGQSAGPGQGATFTTRFPVSSGDPRPD